MRVDIYDLGEVVDGATQRSRGIEFEVRKFGEAAVTFETLHPVGAGAGTLTLLAPVPFERGRVRFAVTSRIVAPRERDDRCRAHELEKGTPIEFHAPEFPRSNSMPNPCSEPTSRRAPPTGN